MSKTKKHQPNIQSLIHNYANRVKTPMVCGNVSSHDGALYSYSARIAQIEERNGRKLLAMSSASYSRTTNKHKSWLSGSVPLPASGNMTALYRPHDGKFLPDEIERVFKQAWNDKQLTWVFHTGRNGEFSQWGYRQMCDEIHDDLEAMRNPRVSRFAIWECFGLYRRVLMSRKYREIFCKDTNADKRLNNAKKILSQYAERLKAKAIRSAEREEKERKRKAGILKFYSEDLEAIRTDWNKVCMSKHEAWANGIECDLRTQAEAINERFNKVCDMMKLSGYEVRNAYETLTGNGFESYGSPLGKTMLRVTGDEIETSRGARLPLGIGKILWARHKGLMHEVLAGRQDVTEGFPIQCGPFTWYGISDGNLRIGCHSIPASEVVRLAEKERW